MNSLNSIYENNGISDETFDIFRYIEDYVTFKRAKSTSILQRDNVSILIKSYNNNSNILIKCVVITKEKEFKIV